MSTMFSILHVKELMLSEEPLSKSESHYIEAVGMNSSLVTEIKNM